MTEVIGQMSKRVEDVIWAKYVKDIPKEIEETANLTCSVLNKLGGGFSVKEISQKGYVLVNNNAMG